MKWRCGGGKGSRQNRGPLTSQVERLLTAVVWKHTHHFLAHPPHSIMTSADFSNESFKPSKLFDLSGRTAIVTGGATGEQRSMLVTKSPIEYTDSLPGILYTGIGLAQAQGLAAAGAKVYILARRSDVTADVVKKYGFAGSLEADVTDKASIEKAVQEFSQKEQALDILVSNAGGPGPTHFGADTSSPEGSTDPAKKHEPISPEEYKKKILDNNSFDNWDDIFRLNSHALLFVAVAFLPLLAKGTERGRKHNPKYTATVISTSSISAFVKQSQMHYAYNASKASVAHLTELIAYEFTYSTKADIRVNSLAPGVFPSQMTTDFQRDPKTSKSNLDDKLPEMAIPARRHGYDADMAGAIQFLAANEYMHGAILPLDGGFTLSEP